jgi:hypothetical protein
MASYDKDGACELIDYTALNKSLHIHKCMLTDEDTYTDEKDPIFVPNEKHKPKKSKIVRNRLSAQKHRDRKKQYIQDCEAKIQFLEEENEKLRILLSDKR